MQRKMRLSVAKRVEVGCLPQWIQVRYVEPDEDPSIVGTEDLCHEDQLQERLGTE
jgi:hypothetical protein